MNEGQYGEDSLLTLVTNGDPTACASMEVEATIRTIAEDARMEGFYNNAPQNLASELQMVRLEMFDAQNQRLTCQASWNLMFEGEQLATIPLIYSLQPDVQGQDVVTEVHGINGVSNDLGMAHLRAGSMLSDRAG